MICFHTNSSCFACKLCSYKIEILVKNCRSPKLLLKRMLLIKDRNFLYEL